MNKSTLVELLYETLNNCTDNTKEETITRVRNILQGQGSQSDYENLDKITKLEILIYDFAVIEDKTLTNYEDLVQCITNVIESET